MISKCRVQTESGRFQTEMGERTTSTYSQVLLSTVPSQSNLNKDKETTDAHDKMHYV